MKKAKEASIVAGFLGDILASVDFGTVGGQDRKAIVGLIDRGIDTLDKRKDIPLGAQYQLHKTLGGALFNLAEFKKSAIQYETAIGIAMEQYGMRSREVVDTRFELWNVFMNSNKLPYIIMTADEQIAAAKYAYGEFSREYMRSRYLYGQALEKIGNYDEAESVERLLLEDSKRILGPDDPYIFRVMTELAVALDFQGRFDESYELEKEIYRRQCATLPETDFHRNLTRLNLTDFLKWYGNYEEAECEARAVLAVWQTQFDMNSGWIRWTYYTISEIRETGGDIDGALAAFYEYLDMEYKRQANGQTVDQLKQTQLDIIHLLLRHDRDDEARKLINQWDLSKEEFFKP